MAREEPQGAVDFVGGQKARQIRAETGGREPARERRGPGAEQGVQEAAHPPGLEALREPGFVRRLRRGPADHRMGAKQSEHFPRHEGREPDDPSALQQSPFVVGARQHDEPVGKAGADQVRLLAPHDVCGVLSLPGEAWKQACLRAFSDRDLDDRRREIGRAGGAGNVGRRHPALAAPDHADERNRKAGLGVEPGSAELPESRLVLARPEPRDAVVGGEPGHDRTGLDEIGPDPARAPIDGDEARRTGRSAHRVPNMRSPASPRPGTI